MIMDMISYPHQLRYRSLWGATGYAVLSAAAGDHSKSVVSAWSESEELDLDAPPSV